MRWISIKIQGVHWGSDTNFKPARLHRAFSKPKPLPKEEMSPCKRLLSWWCWGLKDEGYLMARVFLSSLLPSWQKVPATPWKTGEHPAYCPPALPSHCPFLSAPLHKSSSLSDPKEALGLQRKPPATPPRIFISTEHPASRLVNFVLK